MLDLLRETWGTQFEQADLALLDSQAPPKERWIHNVDWAKRRLVVDGLIHKPGGVPYGAWVLTDAGRRAAEALVSRG